MDTCLPEANMVSSTARAWDPSTSNPHPSLLQFTHLLSNLPADQNPDMIDIQPPFRKL